MSHSLPENLDRCVLLPVGKSRLHLCARCIGLYPATAAGLLTRLGDVDLPIWADSALSFALPLLGALAWVLEQAGLPLNKIIRVLSGILLGAGLGWVMGLHLTSPWPPEMARLAIGLGGSLIVGLSIRWVRRSSNHIRESDLKIDWEDELLRTPSGSEAGERGVTRQKHSNIHQNPHQDSVSIERKSAGNSKKSIVER